MVYKPEESDNNSLVGQNRWPARNNPTFKEILEEYGICRVLRCGRKAYILQHCLCCLGCPYFPFTAKKEPQLILYA